MMRSSVTNAQCSPKSVKSRSRASVARQKKIHIAVKKRCFGCFFLGPCIYCVSCFQPANEVMQCNIVVVFWEAVRYIL